MPLNKIVTNSDVAAAIINDELDLFVILAKLDLHLLGPDGKPDGLYEQSVYDMLQDSPRAKEPGQMTRNRVRRFAHALCGVCNSVDHVNETA